jgi:hypothetical protein
MLAIALWFAMLTPRGILAQDAAPANVLPATVSEVQATPDTLVEDPVLTYGIVSPKIFWNVVTPANCDPDANTHSWDDVIRRVAIQGSITRTVYSERSEGDGCGPSITSNVVSDGIYLYFVHNGIHRLSVEANPGDPTEKFGSALLGPSGPSEILRSAEIPPNSFLYVLTASKGLWRIDTQPFTGEQLLTAGQVGANPHNFQTDGEFLYWLVNDQLRQMRISDKGISTLSLAGVNGYGLRPELCFIAPCDPDARIFLGVGHQIKRYRAENFAFEEDIFTAPDTDDRIGEVEVSGDNVFFVQEQQTTCQPFCSYNTLLKRVQYAGATPAELIYQGQSASLDFHTIRQLRAFGGDLYWIDGFNERAIKRLPENAAALPLTNLRITNIEITQAIQDLSNSVRVIRGKRTFVRVHVRSDGPAVGGVTALLSRLAFGSPVGEPLRPVNPSGQYLAVSPTPDRSVLDQSFLFELPMDWVNDPATLVTGLALRAEVNPYKYPAQASYDNNVKDVSKVFSESGRYDVRFVLFRYTVAGVEFVPDLEVDFMQTLSWIRRAYPIASTPGWIGETSPGFRPGYTYVTDNALKNYITQSECDYDDDMCASDYVHGLLEDWDEEWTFDYAPMYGIMPVYISPYDGQGYFPRGSTSGDTSNGPSGIPCMPFGTGCGWDVDGAFTDWYAGHEIGHLLDRDHPTKGGDPDPEEDPVIGCNHSQDDDDFPYNDARIGVGDLFGFDMGDPKVAAIATPIVYPPNGAFDVMSYCDPNQWVSDYTYNGLYDEIIDFAAAAQAADANHAQLTGNYLFVYGVIEPDTEEGHFVRVRHKNGDYTPPPSGDTDYALRFLDAGNTPLATVDLPTTVDPDRPERRLFNADFTYVAGTRTVELVHQPSDQVYDTYSLSATAPVIENVELAAATNPVSGTVTLSWSASDADGDPLMFDVHYSADNGVTFQPLHANLTANSTPVNTLELGGSSQARFQVTASDGSHTDSAITDVFALAHKPPVVHIANPGNGHPIHYGQLINFIGDAFDPQYETFAEGDLQWSSEDGPLGTGAALPVTTLPVGEHLITFSAKNSAGLQASTSITVVVDDDLNITGPTLNVAPGQLGWHFEEGTSAVQTATLYIANVGAGIVNWTATTAAPWLSLSAASGTTPAAITVTADPTQMPPGATVVSSVVVTGLVGSDVVVGQATVPASASFGNGYVGPAANPERFPPIFLPLITSRNQ